MIIFKTQYFTALYNKMKLYFALPLLCMLLHITSAQLVPNMYCGLDNCYDVLGVTRDSSKSEISKIYRQMARKYHPDFMKSQGKAQEEIDEGTELFMKIATAYETLKDPQSKEEYNYYLDHPEEFYYNYYRYLTVELQINKTQ